MKEKRFDLFETRTTYHPSVHSMLRRSADDLTEQPKERRYSRITPAVV
ncbi:MAG: hypothetical protein PUD43_01050 [Clostridia bacterium]|nr:hypothetical protein [Clostridia bacterium]